MVFKKPYAFIIRHFRLIHLIMLVCTVFILNSTLGIHNLFNSLQRSNTYTYAGAENYVNGIVYFAIFIISIISGILFLLLKEKKKPVKFYFFTFIYTIILIILYVYFFSTLKTLQYELISADTILTIKDLSFLITVPQYLIIALSFTRGIGFNIKQFNFSKDFQELDIVDNDSLEFEILIGQNNYIYRRKIRRALREIKYYIKENKFVLMCICLAIVLFIGFSGFNYYNKNIKKYNSKDLININGISYNINKSYITAYDYKGERVKDGYKYVVVNLNLYNASYEKRSLNLDLINLTDGTLAYHPTLTMNSKFYDLGMPYKKNDLIDSYSSINSILVFEIPDTVKTNKFLLRVQYDIDTSLNNIIVRYKNFNIQAKNIDTNPSIKNVNLRETINSDVVMENKFSITINNYKITDVYDNKYVVCSSTEKCEIMSSIISSTAHSLKTMIVVDFKGYTYEDANFTKYFDNFNKIFQNFAKVRYKIGEDEYIKNVEIVENSDVADKVFIKIERDIFKASSVSLELRFRNNFYNIPLKTKQ